MGKTTNKLVSFNVNLTHNDIIFAENDLLSIEESHKKLIEELELGPDAILVLDKHIHLLRTIKDSVAINLDITLSQRDAVLAIGELLSSNLLTLYFKKIGYSVTFLDSRTVISTNSDFGNAEVSLELTYQLINQAVTDLHQDNNIIIMGGFIGSDEKKRTTTIGRGGSDYTAAIVANAVNAKLLEIWTDVDGIMTIDPKFSKDARRILHLSYDEAAELAYFGAKVLHPKTIGPAIKKQIPILVKNTFKPEAKGTTIENKEDNPKMLKALSYWDGVTVINIKSNRMLGAYGFLSKVFEIFKNYQTSVDLIATSEVSISLTIDNTNNLPHLLNELQEFSSVTVTSNQAIISAVGDGIKETAGLASRYFGILNDINIQMVSIGASEVNISVVVNSADMEKALNLLHNEFFTNINEPSVFE
jgi:aspartate kinase